MQNQPRGTTGRPYTYPSQGEIDLIRAQRPQLICPACDATRVRGCQSCSGRGLVCPTCRGVRFVKRSLPERPGYEVTPCPGCAPHGVHDPLHELDQVKRHRRDAFLDAQNAQRLSGFHATDTSTEHGGRDQ